MNQSVLGMRPWIVKLGIGLTLLNSWILFEEIVVDRHGLWRYMPYYRVGDACVWDLGATIAIAVFLLWPFRRSTA
ncbi:MAG TPA: hypothetical protein VE077_21015 [Candidatus Methylomirabilis sp.]|nr:hypothetical protein [Candidatus Methylomirabilis sp.]